MAFDLTLRADLKATNGLLERVARALERILLEQYNVTYGHCAEVAIDPAPKEQPTVQYATDEATARARMIEAMGLVRRMEGDERELEQDTQEFGI